MRYIEIARFSSRLEAEAIGHALDPHEIPFLVQSPDIGIFGPGHVGTVPMGVALLVPEDRVGEVEHLLKCVVQPLEEGVLGEEVDAETEAAFEEAEAMDDDVRALPGG